MSRAILAAFDVFVLMFLQVTGIRVGCIDVCSSLMSFLTSLCRPGGSLARFEGAGVAVGEPVGAAA